MPRKQKEDWPLRTDADTRKMTEAIDRLEQYVGLRRTSEHQLKLADVSFWPNTGTIHIDACPPHHVRGIGEMILILEARNLLHPRPCKGLEPMIINFPRDDKN